MRKINKRINKKFVLTNNILNPKKRENTIVKKQNSIIKISNN